MGRESRFKPNQAATLRVLEFNAVPFMQVSVLDISANGMRLRSRLPLDCGASVEIELDHATVRGTICRCQPERDCYELGVQVSITTPKEGLTGS